MFITPLGGFRQPRFSSGKTASFQPGREPVKSGGESPSAPRFGLGGNAARRWLPALTLILGGSTAGCSLGNSDPESPENAPPVSAPNEPPKGIGAIDPAWLEVAPGVELARFGVQLDRGPVQINALRVNLNDPNISIKVRRASEKKLHDRAELTEMDEAGDIAGVNASFFRTLETYLGLPIGLTMQEGKVITGPTFNRTAMGITTDGSVIFGKPQLDASLTLADGEAFKVDNINQLMPDMKSHVMIYTPEFGPKAPTLARNTVQVAFSNGVAIAADKKPLEIPEDGFVLSVPESHALFQSFLKADAVPEVELKVGLMPEEWQNVQEAVSGGPLLLKDGKLAGPDPEQDFTEEFFKTPNPRMAAGITDDNYLLLVGIDGRVQGFSVGTTIPETGRIMKKLGARQATSFDGGGSEQVEVNDYIINVPSDGQPRSVPTGVFVNLESEAEAVPEETQEPYSESQDAENLNSETDE